MPVIDLTSSKHEASAIPLECDLCIIGSGPAGATIARELGKTSLRVTVLEGGGFERSEEADSLNEIESVGRPRVVDEIETRVRMVGGSTAVWGGRCGPFDDIDFEERSWVAHSGWPIKNSDIEPYYHRSAEHLGLGLGFGFSDERFWTLAGRDVPVPDVDQATLLPFFWQHSRDPNESYPYEYLRIGRHLGQQLRENVTLIAGATVLQIVPTESGQAIDSIEYALPDGQKRILKTAIAVVCGGGIENARLLLASNSIVPQGLGNHNDVVGRYLMDHWRGSVGLFDVKQSASLLKRFGRSSIQGNLFVAGLRLSPQMQRDEGLLNCAAWLGEWVAEDDPWDAVKRVVSRKANWRSDLSTIAMNSGLIARGLKDHFMGSAAIPRKMRELTLDSMCEQVPNVDSRITLSAQLDRFGMPLSCIDWRTHENESRTIRRMAEVITEQFGMLGLPTPELPQWVQDGDDFPAHWKDVAHPIGATRMSEDPKQGVVDADCRVHGVAGLYVAGSSVFPTGGHVNPTQMIVALAVRIADHIKMNAETSRVFEAGVTRKS